MSQGNDFVALVQNHCYETFVRIVDIEFQQISEREIHSLPTKKVIRFSDPLEREYDVNDYIVGYSHFCGYEFPKDCKSKNLQNKEFLNTDFKDIDLEGYNLWGSDFRNSTNLHLAKNLGKSNLAECLGDRKNIISFQLDGYDCVLVKDSFWIGGTQVSYPTLDKVDEEYVYLENKRKFLEKHGIFIKAYAKQCGFVE